MKKWNPRFAALALAAVCVAAGAAVWMHGALRGLPGEFSPVTYDQVVELTAWLCETFRLDPETDVIRHYDVTEKLCPLYYVEHPEAWDAFRADVAAAMEEDS